MKMQRGCYCGIAALIGAGALLLAKWGCCGYPPAAWNSRAWTGAALLVLLFGICGAISCAKSHTKSEKDTQQTDEK